jgi:signal transduction histidine kinase
MNWMPASNQPVYAQVDSQGHLIYADNAILHLQISAGGKEGGLLVIPALAQLAVVTHSIKMRMARAIRVASANEDFELWVESQLIGQIVHLKVTGWRSLAISDVSNNTDIENSDGVIHLTLDSSLRLLYENGLPLHIAKEDVIGKGISSLFPSNDESNANLLQLLEHHSDFECTAVTLADSDVRYSATARGEISNEGLFSGYFIGLRPLVSQAEYENETSEQTETLFGHQLGSALRQPLGRIIANAETIGNKLQGPIRENYALYAKDIADAARHLVALVDDLGDLEAVERDDFVTAKDQIELGDIARRVAGLLALKASDNDIRIITPDATNVVPAVAEFRRVLQIVINLVTNALRYSPGGTEVTISISQQGSFASLSVIDQGAGIAVSDHNKIFEKFERLGRSGDGGSGLGLYISRKLARAMGGDIIISPATNSGAEFILRLPLN